MPLLYKIDSVRASTLTEPLIGHAASTVPAHWSFDSPDAAHYAQHLEALQIQLSILADKPEETIASTLAALWHLAAGTALSAVRAPTIALPALTNFQRDKLGALVAQRLAGTPLAHLTERQEFMGLEMLASPAALIPRHETELLARAALAKLNAMVDAHAHPHPHPHPPQELIVIDVCTGSGNLALALAAHAPHARVWAADLSEEAVALAKLNAQHVGLAERVHFATGDLLAAFDHPQFHGKVDLLVCNPPYISSGKIESMPDEISRLEPRLAFDGGPLGIRILQRLISEAPKFVRPGGWLAFEVGLGQGRGVRRKLEQQHCFEKIEEIVDQNGNTRSIVASIRARADTANGDTNLPEARS